jgi:hypothetical protein
MFKFIASILDSISPKSKIIEINGIELGAWEEVAPNYFNPFGRRYRRGQISDNYVSVCIFAWSSRDFSVEFARDFSVEFARDFSVEFDGDLCYLGKLFAGSEYSVLARRASSFKDAQAHVDAFLRKMAKLGAFI